MRLKACLLFAGAVMILTGSSLMLGCKKEPETPGQKLDQAIQQSGEAMQEMGQKVEDAAE